MNNIKNDSIFISKLTKEHEITKNKSIYTILPEYGQGSIAMYKIIQGMYLTLNDLRIKHNLKNQSNVSFSSPYIKIDYCFKGGYRYGFKNGMVGIVNKGNSIYYVGSNTFTEVDLTNSEFESISLMCYLNEITESLENIFGLSNHSIEEYCDKLSKRKEFLIIDTDIEILRIVNDIYEYIKCDNIGLIKLRAIELLLLEINNFDCYKSRKKKYYTRETIDKIEEIKDFIEENINEHFVVEDLSKRFNIGKTKLKECFKYVYGMGPYAYLRNYRMEKASELLKNNNYNILEIANMVGYSSPSKFGAAFKERFAVNPLKYKKMLG